MSRAAVLVLGLAAGCGRLGFDARVASDDGGDGSIGATCWSHWLDHTIALTTPQLVAELGATTVASDASIAGDGLTLYYVVQAASLDIEYATRSAVGQPWVPRGLITELAAPGIDTKLTVTADGLVGVFSSDRGGDVDLWLTSRPTAGDQFGAPLRGPVMTLETVNPDYDAYISDDGLHLYYAPGNGGGGQSIVRATRASRAASFAVERALTEISFPDTYSDPALSPDELVIAYAATNAGVLYYATRSAITDPFSSQIAVPGADGSGRETDTALSHDGCELYFTSTRAGFKQVFMANVVP